MWKFNFGQNASIHDLDQVHAQFSEDVRILTQKHNSMAEMLKLQKETIEHMGKVAIERTKQIQELTSNLDKVSAKGTPAELSSLAARIEALELRQSQMHGMLTEEHPVNGKKKLSPLGKRIQTFYGR